jgi:radical SAM superfamily enzyme YgiQ (UPF0313 family)
MFTNTIVKTLYKNYFNFIEAPNNDGSNDIHKATFSSILIRKLLHLYVKKDAIVYDSFMGTGTTAMACIEEKINYIANISKRLGVQITWGGYIRVDLIWSKKNYNELFDSGLRNAYFGLESFHPEASKIIGKGWNGQHGKEWIPKLYNDLWNKQVKIEASFIVGLPKETEESLLETVKWINDINAGYMFFYPLDL